MQIVKLGGSLLGTEPLVRWLQVLARVQSDPVIIVPGGGVFADTVRVHQARAGYDDAAAHAMALLAMEQFAHVCLALEPTLLPVRSPREIAQCADQGKAGVWLASAMVLADKTIPAHWGVTSDSLAAWLALKIKVDRLTLVKHSASGVANRTVAQWAEQGVVDPAFPEFCSRLRCPVDVISSAELEHFLRGEEIHGTC